MFNPLQSATSLTIDWFSVGRGITVDFGSTEDGVSQMRSYTGTLRTYLSYKKEKLTITLENLSQQQVAQLKQIVYQTGANVYHTVLFSTPNMDFVWDGVTTPSGKTNMDINRVRGQMYLSNFVEVPYDGNSYGFYKLKLSALEV